MKKPKKIPYAKQDFFREASEFFKKANYILKKLSNFLDHSSEQLLETKKENHENRETLFTVKTTNENVDATLCNVLLAIRQNEYLQAWYPEHAIKPIPKKIVSPMKRQYELFESR